MCPIRTTPAHDPASVVGHGDRKGREERMNTGTGAGSQAGKQKRQGPTRNGLRCVLTLAFQAFGLCHVIQFLLRPRSVLRLRAVLPQRPGPRLDCRQTAPPFCRRISRGEKIPHGGRLAVLPAAAKTSTGRGEGARNPAGAGLGRRAPKRPPISSEISAAEVICFCSFPPQSCGCGSDGTGSGGCRDP